MTGEEAKKKRLRFGWRDSVVLVVSGALTAAVFVWALLNSNAVETDSAVLVTYANMKVMDNLTVISPSGEKMDYIVSFRRELKEGEAYQKPDSSYGDVSINVASLRNISDFSKYTKTYFILTSDQLTPEFNGFNLSGRSLYGPQVDLKVSQGGIRVIKEDSPEHDCSNQGQVNQGNLPVVCLPNNINFRILNNAEGPDA